MNLKPRRAEEPEVNLVSLIDVVLMIVVFFMLSSTFVDENRMKIRLPQATAAPVPRGAEERLVVEITDSGAYRVNGAELVNSSPEMLRRAILRLPIGDRSMPITVRADGRASHQSVVTAMDVIGKLGFREIDIATVRSDEESATVPATVPEGGAAPGGAGGAAGQR